jgi:hypothetical protein
MTLTFKDLRLSGKDSSSSTLARKAQGSRAGETVGLLLRRMGVLNIDPDALDGADPLLFRELQGFCSLCRNNGRCARDLAHDAADDAGQGWKEYCRNGATLSKLAPCRAASFSQPRARLCLTEVDRMLKRAKETTRFGKYTYIEYARLAEMAAYKIAFAVVIGIVLGIAIFR